LVSGWFTFVALGVASDAVAPSLARSSASPVVERELARQAEREASVFRGRTTISAGSVLDTDRGVVVRPCPEGVGVDSTGRVSWKDGDARHVYVLEPGRGLLQGALDLALPAGTVASTLPKRVISAWQPSGIRTKLFL